MNKCIILYSGGQDSRLLLELATILGYEPYCILIDYNQIHKKELEVARKLLDEKGVLHHTVILNNLWIKSKLTNKETTEPYPGVSAYHVPSRNLMFIAIAAGVAESMKIPEIWYGANREDYGNEFPDCFQEWIGRVNSILKFQSTFPITVEAPLLGLPKKTINKMCELAKIDSSEYFSGYGGL